jgi:DHA1 family inner membrane transport protein
VSGQALVFHEETAMRKLPLAIWAMVVGAFAMGADEFIVAGVVREIADSLNVTIGAVGALEVLTQ